MHRFLASIVLGRGETHVSLGKGIAPYNNPVLLWKSWIENAVLIFFSNLLKNQKARNIFAG